MNAVDPQNLRTRVQALEEENEHLKQTLSKVEEAQFQIYTDRLQDAVMKRFTRFFAPILFVIAVLGYFGFSYFLKSIDAALVSPRIDTLITSLVDDRVDYKMDETIKTRFRQLQAIENSPTATVHNKYWVLTGSSIVASDVLSERERIQRYMSSHGIDHRTEYNNLKIIKTRPDQTRPSIYSLAIGPYDTTSDAESMKSKALQDGFRKSAYIKEVRDAEVIQKASF